jgi:hypothetical protein
MAVSKQWQLVRSWLRKTYNKEVYEYFKDLPPGVDPDNSSGRSTTFAVCLIGANDSQGIAAQKQENFKRLKEKAGMTDYLPAHDYERLPGIAFRGIPQVQLWFREKQSAARAAGRSTNPCEARVSFRLPKDSWEAELPAREMARKIKRAFATPIFQIETGELKATYLDKDRGYDFRLLVRSKAEAKKIIEAVMDLNSHTPNWRLLKVHTSEAELFTDTPERFRVLGKTISVNNHRPKTIVYFAYAIAKVPPRTAEVPLVDTTRRYPKPYENAPNTFLGRESRTGEQHNSVKRLA